jgi:hypothetical protein
MDAQGAFPATLRISHRWVDLEDFIWSALAAVRAKLRQPSFASLDEFCRQPSAGNRFLMEFNGQRHATVSALIGIKPATIARRLEIRELLGAMKSSREYGWTDVRNNGCITAQASPHERQAPQTVNVYSAGLPAGEAADERD